MEISRHRNLVGIFQFVGFLISFLMFFLSIDFLKENNALNPAVFFVGPAVAVVIIRLIMIFYFPPMCSSRDCSGRMLLHLTRSRDYSCLSCGLKVKLNKLKDDHATQKRVNRLLVFVAFMILILVSLAIIGIVKNSS